MTSKSRSLWTGAEISKHLRWGMTTIGLETSASSSDRRSGDGRWRLWRLGLVLRFSVVMVLIAKIAATVVSILFRCCR